MNSILGTAINGLINYGISSYNNQASAEMARQDRKENYLYGEMSAENAYNRQIDLYNKFYSPAALMQQYKEAGLSPSLMFGGTPGQGGTSVPQGHGTAGIQTPYMPVSMLEAAQAANLMAQTEKTKEETKNIATDTERQEIQKGIEELQAGQYKTEWAILNSTWTENGKEKSIFEAAQEHYNYESFLEWCRGKETNQTIKEATTTEAGQKILRSIYTSASYMNRDIMLLSKETVEASFQLEIVKAMQNTEFAKLNAEAAVQYLKQNIETSKLTETQKGAWNNLLERLGKKGSTTRDIIVVLGMILNNAMSNWHMPNITTNNNTFTKLNLNQQ